MSIRRHFLVISLFVCALLNAQTNDGFPVTRVMVSVRDSTSKDLLPGASVIVRSDTDSLSLVTSSFGSVSWEIKRFPFEYITIQVSSLGYKTKTEPFQINRNQYNNIDFYLSEDPLQINAIVIKGEAVAMVMHGDTTVFNASAFSTMTGSTLRSLLEKLPGVEITGNTINYNGAPIDRILFNGQNLFGKDMSNAVDLVYSNEVQSVSVYEKTAVDDIDNDGYSAKERVMDVRTWQPLEHVGSLQVEASAGAFYHSPDYQAEGEVRVGDYVLGSRPRVSFNYVGSHNDVEQTYPSDKNAVELSIGKDVYRKGGYQTRLSIEHKSSRNQEGYTDYWFPSADWEYRRDSSSALRSDAGLDLNWLTNGYFYVGRTKFNGSSSVTFARHLSLNRNYLLATKDVSTTAFENNQRDSSTALNLLIRGNVDRKMSKARRHLTLIPVFKLDYAEGNDARFDTLSTSMRKEYLAGSMRMISVDPEITVKWTEPLGRKSLLALSVSTAYNHKDLRKIYMDRLSDEMNLNNSKDYSTDALTGRLAFGYRYGRKNDGLFADISFGLKSIGVVREERLANVDDWMCRFTRPTVDVELSYSGGPDLLSLAYKERDAIPMAEQLRPVVNDANPIFLRAGSASLQQTVVRSTNVKYGHSFWESNANLTFDAQLDYRTNEIVDRTEYFNVNTYLDNYGYTAIAGSSLVTPVNVSGGYLFNCSIKYDRYFPRPEISADAKLSYSIVSNPFFLGTDLHVNHITARIVGLGLSRNTKSMFLILFPSVSINKLSFDDLTIDNYLSPSFRAELKQRLGRHFEYHFLGVFSGVSSSLNDANYVNTQLNGSVSMLWGENDRYRISIYGSNLINTLNERDNYMANDYIRFAYDSVLGRAMGISFVYRFNRR